MFLPPLVVGGDGLFYFCTCVLNVVQEIIFLSQITFVPNDWILSTYFVQAAGQTFNCFSRMVARAFWMLN